MSLEYKEKDDALLVDLYELTMAQSYFENRMNSPATFDLFIRRLPSHRSYLLACGLEDALCFLSRINFSAESLEYLKGQKIFSKDFLEYLGRFEFKGDVFALAEGTIFFPNEPVIRVTAPLIEAQIVESFLLNTINLQTTIASKASRVVWAAGKRPVYDFSLRRTQGKDAALKVARASYIAGCRGTSNVLAGKIYGIPIVGTMAHSYVMSFESELSCFRAFSASFPKNSILLIDTYDDIQGAKNAIKIARELAKRDCRLKGVRIDSGNLAKISKKIRRMLDEAGFPEVKVVASGDLDEYKIEQLLKSGAKVDSFGVGTRMGVSQDWPYVDAVYKLSELTDTGGFLPTMKLSKGKITYPGRKQVYRILNKDGRFLKDIIGLETEKLKGEPLLVKVMQDGQIIGSLPGLEQIKERAQDNLSRLPDRYKQLKARLSYPVQVSPRLNQLTRGLTKMLKKRSKQR